MDLHHPPVHIGGPNDEFMIQMSKYESQVKPIDKWTRLDYDPLFTTISLGGCRRATEMLNICVAHVEMVVFCLLFEIFFFSTLPPLVKYFYMDLQKNYSAFNAFFS